MAPATILITGANRGIGLELVRRMLQTQEAPKALIATCRNPGRAHDLQALAGENDNLHILPLDVTHHSTYSAFVADVDQIVGDNGLNLVIHNAGVMPDSEETPEALRRAFEVNTIAPKCLSEALLPWVEKAASRLADQPMGISKAAIVMMSSAIASLTENRIGGLAALRCSKTALNQVMKNLAHDVQAKGILVLSIHPGWVQTEMGGSQALISTAISCAGMLNTLEGLGEEDQASFIRRRTSPKVAHIAYLKSLQRMSSNLHAKREDAVKLKDARVEAGLNELNFDLWHWNDALTKSHIHLDDGMSANLAIFEPRTFRALTAVAAHKAMTPAQAGGLGLPPCGPGIEL
eukprot:snap_masked-scaffold591_size129331-processed-gene-0.14 protein:Tk08234 transcript:snap_masked-scaffold591_size129331-processed-gene-0.14-mRNA-1 annotation:"uncharacterized oxidoreductase -like"